MKTIFLNYITFRCGRLECLDGWTFGFMENWTCGHLGVM